MRTVARSSDVPLHIGCAALALSSALFAVGCNSDRTTEERAVRANTMGEERAREREVAAAPTPTPTPIQAEVAAAVAAPNAEDQSSEPADVEITRHIREVVSSSPTLSAEARTCTIVTRATVVTLRGGVADDSERRVIAALARGTSGVTRVDNLLVVSD